MPIIYKDAEAKKYMRESWPIYKDNWLGAPGGWLRLLPFPVSRGPQNPYLHTSGGALLSNPDGLFGSFGANFVDLIVLEHCSSKQNFFDKRSRYTASNQSVLLALPESWCNNWKLRVHGGNGGTWAYCGELVQRSGNPSHPAWLGASAQPTARANSIDWKFPVRSLLCIYFLKPSDKASLEKSGLALPRHEYVTTHSRLTQITSSNMRKWLASAMNPNQFL